MYPWTDFSLLNKNDSAWLFFIVLNVFSSNVTVKYFMNMPKRHFILNIRTLIVQFCLLLRIFCINIKFTRNINLAYMYISVDQGWLCANIYFENLLTIIGAKVPIYDEKIFEKIAFLLRLLLLYYVAANSCCLQRRKGCHSCQLLQKGKTGASSQNLETTFFSWLFITAKFHPKLFNYYYKNSMYKLTLL